MAMRSVEMRMTSDQSGFAFWEDGEPVCLVGYTGPTPNGIRIGPVYTPPRHRRKGYASAATAVLSRQLIDEGRRFCVLFADLDNPTSNHIYQQIGYQPVADVAIYTFTH
jgi:predicted GNAT family acetyltransferase